MTRATCLQEPLEYIASKVSVRPCQQALLDRTADSSNASETVIKLLLQGSSFGEGDLSPKSAFSEFAAASSDLKGLNLSKPADAPVKPQLSSHIVLGRATQAETTELAFEAEAKLMHRREMEGVKAQLQQTQKELQVSQLARAGKAIQKLHQLHGQILIKPIESHSQDKLGNASDHISKPHSLHMIVKLPQPPPGIS